MKFLQSTILAAVAAGALLSAVAAPAEAFTLSAPAATASDAHPNVDRVWWDRWGHWHPNHLWGWGGPGPWGWHHRHCWINGFGVRVCRW